MATENIQKYAKTPEYVRRTNADDQVAILVCRIKVWKPSNTDWFTLPDNGHCLTIRECESIEVHNTYKELVNTAVLRFPRGTVIEKHLNANVTVASAQNPDSVTSQPIAEATVNAEVISSETNPTENFQNEQTQAKVIHAPQSFSGSSVDRGLVDFNEHVNSLYLLDKNDFTLGNRIEIRLGYAYSEEEFITMNKDTSLEPDNMELVFTGFITGCSASTPLEVSCKNMGHILNMVNVPSVISKSKLTVKDFLDPNGKYKMLDGTGIELSQDSTNANIEFGALKITPNLTVADVLENWKKLGIMSYMVDAGGGVQKLRVGFVYYAGKGGGKMPTDNQDYLSYTKDKSFNIIQFDWDVAEDGLGLQNTDKRYVAVAAQARGADNKFFKLTIRRNSDASDAWDIENADGGWLVQNETKPRKKAQQKVENGSTTKQEGKLINKVSLSEYNVISYISTTPNCTREKLIEEAKQYWANFTPNGITGKLTLFGDRHISPAMIVGLVDMRHPQKNGWYLVEAVDISFGVGGYRKSLTLPYKLANFDKIPEYKP